MSNLPKTPVDRSGGEEGRWSEAKLDRVSTMAAILAGAAALGIVFTASASSDQVLLYTVFTLLGAVIAALLLWIIRLSTFGTLPPDVDEFLPSGLLKVGQNWLVVKFGVLFATIYLLVAAGVGLLFGSGVGRLLEAFVLLVLAMMVGDTLYRSAISISLIQRGRTRPA